MEYLQWHIGGIVKKVIHLQEDKKREKKINNENRFIRY